MCILKAMNGRLLKISISKIDTQDIWFGILMYSMSLLIRGILIYIMKEYPSENRRYIVQDY